MCTFLFLTCCEKDVIIYLDEYLQFLSRNIISFLPFLDVFFFFSFVYVTVNPCR